MEAAYGSWRLDEGWSVNVVRNLNDWVVGKYEDILHLLSDVHVTTERDQIVWKPKKNGEISVKSFYEYLMGMGD